MKYLLILAALAAVAHAKLNFYVNDKPIVHEKLSRMEFGRHSVLKTDDSVAELSQDQIDALPKNVVDDMIISFLENARDNFETGWPELGIPPLDPFTWDNASVTLVQPLVFKANIMVKDVLLTGLKDFIIDNIKFNILRLSFDFNLIAPDTVFQSGFEVDGKIAVFYPYKFAGFVRSRMQGLSFGGKMALGTTSDGYLTLKTLEFIIDMDEMSLFVSGVDGEGPLEEIFDWLLSQLSEDFLSQSLAAVSKQLSESLHESINEVLGTISLSDLIG